MQRQPNKNGVKYYINKYINKYTKSAQHPSLVIIQMRIKITNYYVGYFFNKISNNNGTMEQGDSHR